MPGKGGKNWMCPLLGKKICEVCCHIELEGGMGAPDTLREVCGMVKKTAPEVHKTCVKCRHGGKKLEKPPRLVSIRDKRGDYVSRGKEFQKVQRDLLKDWKDRIRKLRGK